MKGPTSSLHNPTGTMASLTELEIFARVVAAGSLSAAGREMGLSPAVVSKRLRRLEERLGSRLLQRTTRKIALTEAGQGYYERVLGILASVEEAESFVVRRSSLARGTLKVSAPTSFGRLHIAPHLKDFLSRNPDLTLNLNLSDDFVDIVGAGYDLAIRIASLDDSSLVARRLAPNHRVLCASPAYLAEAGEPQSLGDLERFRLLAAANQSLWRLEGRDGPAALKVESAIETNSSEVVRETVLAGLGIALRSTWDVGPEIADGRLRIVLANWRGSPSVAIHAVYPSRRFLAAKVRVFIDFMTELYGQQPYWDRGLDFLSPKEAA